MNPLQRRLRLVFTMLTVTVVMIAGSTSADAANRGHKMKGLEFMSWSVQTAHNHLGPDSDTDYGKGIIKSWPGGQVGQKYWTPTKAFQQYHNPTMTPRAVDTPSADAGRYEPNSWYNPFSWNWGHIFGAIWNEFSKCFSGALKGTIPSVVATTAVNLLFRGARLYVGPAGYAAIAIGGCIGAILSG